MAPRRLTRGASPRTRSRDSSKHMKKVLRLRRNADGTVTLRCGRYVEHIDAANKGLVDTWDSVKIAAMTAGFHLTPEEIDELFREARGLPPT